jgi:ABC-type branched-subunit amino acid transport system substrate-binding protein
MSDVKFFAPTFVVENPRGDFEQVREQFNSRFPNETFTYSAAYAYDAFLVLTQALLEARSEDPEALRKAMASPKDALTDTYEFDEQGDYVPSITLAEYGEDGSIQPVERSASQPVETAQ